MAADEDLKRHAESLQDLKGLLDRSMLESDDLKQTCAELRVRLQENVGIGTFHSQRANMLQSQNVSTDADKTYKSLYESVVYENELLEKEFASLLDEFDQASAQQDRLMSEIEKDASSLRQRLEDLENAKARWVDSLEMIEKQQSEVIPHLHSPTT